MFSAYGNSHFVLLYFVLPANTNSKCVPDKQPKNKNVNLLIGNGKVKPAAAVRNNPGTAVMDLARLVQSSVQ
jgi:hypothetical protein